MKYVQTYLASAICFLLSVPQFAGAQYSKVEEISMFAGRLKAPVIIEPVKNQNKIIFNATNRSYYSYHITIDFSEFQNLTPRIFNYKTLLHPGSNKLFELSIIDGQQSTSYQYKFSTTLAVPGEPDLSFPLLMPIAEGRKVMLDTVNLENHSVIFTDRFRLEAGDSVFAVRKGTVTALPGNEKEYERIIQTTSLEVLHGDGTIAVYVGMDPGKIFVSAGQTIYPGQPLGIIGSDRILTFRVFSMTGATEIKSFNVNYSGPGGTIITSKNINGCIVSHPLDLIKKEMTTKELRKFEKADLF